jgi:FAD/FMN-containing dehydrogenase
MASRILPPGLDEATLDAFFDEVTNLIGEENVSRDPSIGNLPGPKGQESYGDPWPLARDHTPSGAVRPATVEEVQHVLKAANEHRVPLWTVSRGKNLGYVTPLLLRLLFCL